MQVDNYIFINLMEYYFGKSIKIEKKKSNQKYSQLKIRIKNSFFRHFLDKS